MFTGTYENSIDNKNRMIVPSKYRNQLGGKCMLARGFDTCLYIYTMEDWDELVAKMRKLRQTDRDSPEPQDLRFHHEGSDYFGRHG